MLPFALKVWHRHKIEFCPDLSNKLTPFVIPKEWVATVSGVRLTQLPKTTHSLLALLWTILSHQVSVEMVRVLLG